MIDLHFQDDLERILRARHRRNCLHEAAGQSRGVCARCDAEAIVESQELADYVAAKTAQA